jgi:lysozyme family protein
MKDYNEFRKSLTFTLKWEGGYVNDPDDPGGETKWGISKRYHPDEDIANLTPERAAEIYKDEYWDKCGCDDIPFPLNTVVFDSAVNCGVARAMGWLKDAPSARDYILARRQFYYGQINKNPTKIKYLRGWTSRCDDLAKFADANQIES